MSVWADVLWKYCERENTLLACFCVVLVNPCNDLSVLQSFHNNCRKNKQANAYTCVKAIADGCQVIHIQECQAVKPHEKYRVSRLAKREKNFIKNVGIKQGNWQTLLANKPYVTRNVNISRKRKQKMKPFCCITFLHVCFIHLFTDWAISHFCMAHALDI